MAGEGQRVLIEGVGGIGGVMAAAMIDNGQNPILVTHNDAITESIRANGLKARTQEREYHVRAEAYTLLDDVPVDEPFDSALLIMKATSVVDAAIQTVPLLHPNGHVVTFQNGIVEDAVGDAIGRHRVVSGIIAWNGIMHGPGDYEKTSPGDNIIGELDGTITPRLERLRDQISCCAPVVMSTNIMGALWGKLVINCTVTTAGALTGETLGGMLKDKATRKLFLDVYTECVDTAEACGITLERIAADPYLLYLPKNAGWFTRQKKDLIARILGRKYRNTKASMLQSFERKRPTEIDFLNGYVVEQAKKTGVHVPLNEALVRMIKEIEQGKRQIGQHNIEELLRI